MKIMRQRFAEATCSQNATLSNNHTYLKLDTPNRIWKVLICRDMASSSRAESSPQIQVARLMQKDEEKKFLEDNADALREGTDGERRRIRRHAKEAGYSAYATALERAINTTESEKQSLITLINNCKSDMDRLVEELRDLGYSG